jgi:hypothetical protein
MAHKELRSRDSSDRHGVRPTSTERELSYYRNRQHDGAPKSQPPRTSHPPVYQRERNLTNRLPEFDWPAILARFRGPWVFTDPDLTEQRVELLASELDRP